MSVVSDVMVATQTQAGSEVDSTKKKTNVRGKTIGNPQLSEKAAKYYEELKRKYSGMDFILVSEDQKAAARAQAGKYANPNKMVVLIDEEKIERMAEDESYRKQYESVIANASSGMSKMAKSLSGKTNANIKGFGMEVKDNGLTSFFAVLDKSSAAQKARIEKKAAEKKEARKAEKKKAAKQEQEERLEKSRQARAEKAEAGRPGNDGDTVTITANSMEELIQKINDYMYMGMSDRIQTEEEKQVGQGFDYSI